MPAPASVADFVAVVRKSGLVPDDKLRPEVERLAGAAGAPATPDQLAQGLVRAGVLTKFQARQLKLGRYKRFVIAGKYRLLELLGVGGMGAVYLCEHIFMKRLVALKVLPPDKLSDPSNVERFYREARSVAALNDPNIVRAYDIDQAEGMHFLVMEYVDGASLQEIVARFGPLDPVRAATYTAQAAYGLQHAGDLGIVHRDIKPANLLLDRTGVVKILDMGLARCFTDTQDNLTAKYDDQCVLGTADYLAPEQALSNVVDIRADIYALGGTLYFLLTGKSPVPDGTIAQKLVYHQKHDPVPVEKYRAGLPAGLVAVLGKMMAKDPGARYQTPAEVAEALAPWCDPHLPSPPGHEMPDLCPAVLALAGHAIDRTKGGSGASRLSGPGRPVLPLQVGSSARVATAEGPETPTGGSLVPLGRTPTEAHVETNRAIRTSPFRTLPADPVPPSPATAPDIKNPTAAGAIGLLPAADRRTRIPVWLVTALSVGLVALAAAAVVLMTGYKARRSAAAPVSSAPEVSPLPNPPAPQAAGEVRPLGATQARSHVGEDRTVVFTVARVGGSKTGNLFLNSKADSRDPENFTVVIPAALASTGRLDPTDVRSRYEGQEVRVRGVIETWNEGVQIQLTDLTQLTPAP